MRSHKQKLDGLMESAFARFRKLPPDVDPVGERVLAGLRRQPEWHAALSPDEIAPTPTRGFSWRWPAIAALASVIAVAVFLPAKLSHSTPAIFENSSGSRSIAYGELVHSGTSDGGTLKLKDGSTVELRNESELSLEAAINRIHVRLHRGDVIVNTAVSSELPPQVETKDMSAEGKTFMVTTKEEGSRVAVIGGEARVVQGTTERTLYPGQQVATAPMRETVTVGEGISWSREAEALLAALQEATAAAVPPQKEFEAAAIHLNTSGSTAARLDHGAERVAISNATLESIIRYAFNDRKTKMSGPPLLTSKRYDIVAKAPSGTSDGDLLLMLQSLLMERFKMKFHRETIDMPIYALTVGKDGHKLRELQPGEGTSGFGGAGALTPGMSSMTTTGDMQNLAGSLSRRLDRPVVDRTGLAGRFSVALTFVSEERRAEVSGPSIFTALQEQLGLKLEAAHGPVEIFVIDQLQEPTAN